MAFKKATNQTAYLKAGLLGFQGSGKTYTAVEIAIGLHKLCRSDKPVFFLDTETGSDWAIQRFNDAGIELMVDKTKAFADLLSGIKEAEKNGFCLIIDSITHYWQEMIAAYKRKKNIGSRMAFHHWDVLKPEWNRFSTAYINSQLHCIVCGRAGWNWGHEDDVEGQKELRKLGTKMKVEADFGFEPSLLIEMERVKGKKLGDSISHLCHVIKDRRMDGETMDGKTFTNPVFENFMPHVECLNLGGAHIGVDEERNSEDLFAPNGESVTSKNDRRQSIVEEIMGELKFRFPTSSKDDKIAVAAIKKHFIGTRSDNEINKMHPDLLQKCFSSILDFFAQGDDIWPSQLDEIIASLKGAKK